MIVQSSPFKNLSMGSQVASPVKRKHPRSNAVTSMLDIGKGSLIGECKCDLSIDDIVPLTMATGGG